MTIPGQPTDGINLAVLNEALLPYATQIALNAGLAGKLNTSGGAVSGLLSFSGVDTPGLQLKSLTDTQITALGAIANGSLLVSSTTNRARIRLNGVTEEVITTAGGQQIGGNLAITGNLTFNSGSVINSGSGGVGTLTINNDGNSRWQFIANEFSASGIIRPATTNLRSLGTSSFRWSTVFGVAGDFSGNLTASGTVRLGTYTVGTLPSSAANTRARAFVSDSNLSFSSANLGATVTAGGSTLVPVFSNGTNWVIG